MADSVRDTLNATMASLSADPTPADGDIDVSNQAPAAEAGEAAAASPPADASPKNVPADPVAQAAADEGRKRGPDGKFLPKEDAATPAEGASAQPQAEQAQSETAKPAAAEPQTPEAIRIPPSLPAAVKSKFAGLDPDVQKAIVTLEDSVQTAKAEWGRKGERLNRFDEIIGPHLPRWQMNGLDEYSGIQSLLAAQSLLDQNPLNGLVTIARSYGLTPAHLAQAFGLSQATGQGPAAEGHGAPTGNPDFQAALQTAITPVLTQVQTLQQQLQSQTQQAEAAEVTRIARLIDEFASKPEHMYFDNVADDVVRYAREAAQAGNPITIDTIASAYERAVWADPSIRPLLRKAETKAEAQRQAAAAEEARKAAEKAKQEKARLAAHAGGSVTGSPSAGAQAPQGPQGSVRDMLRAAMEEHGARA